MRGEQQVGPGDVDALECCCVNATRVNADDANDGSDASGYADAKGLGVDDCERVLTRVGRF